MTAGTADVVVQFPSQVRRPDERTGHVPPPPAEEPRLSVPASARLILVLSLGLWAGIGLAIHALIS